MIDADRGAVAPNRLERSHQALWLVPAVFPRGSEITSSLRSINCLRDRSLRCQIRARGCHCCKIGSARSTVAKAKSASARVLRRSLPGQCPVQTFLSCAGPWRPISSLGMLTLGGRSRYEATKPESPGRMQTLDRGHFGLSTVCQVCWQAEVSRHISVSLSSETAFFWGLWAGISLEITDVPPRSAHKGGPGAFAYVG
jgi:hypothetical protein